uniref:Phosphodiesterase n=1 Tax=Spongospora subterranea TaxID=70186 RepID=A0A0H5QQE1_9EUKA|eukprot:CRZ04280.1 hypothetical protein [Spongospora subterranea]
MGANLSRFAIPRRHDKFQPSSLQNHYSNNVAVQPIETVSFEKIDVDDAFKDVDFSVKESANETRKQSSKGPNLGSEANSQRRPSLRETLLKAVSVVPSTFGGDAVDHQEIKILRERLEQAEWQLMDIRTLTSTETYQLIAQVMKDIDEFEEMQFAVASDRSKIDEKSEHSNQGDFSAIAQRVLMHIMRFRQQGHTIYNDVNDEIIADSGLDLQTKKWLTNEFTRASIIRPPRGSFTMGDLRADALAAGVESTSIPRPIAYTISEKLINSESLDVLEYDQQQLVQISLQIFDIAGVLSPYNINPTLMLGLLESIAQKYCSCNPFHNFSHGVDVLHSCHIILLRTDLDATMSAWQKLGLLLAAIGHDIDHPGTNNAFQVNTGTPLAMLYNDQSVLENHHAATLYKIISDPSNQVFDDMKPYIKSDMRSVILSCIMATDMKFHFDLVAKGDMNFEKIKMYKRHATGPRSSSASLQSNIEEAQKREVKVTLNLILHCADINNTYKQWPLAKRWSDLVTEEFFAQGDQERSMRLPISPFMDRRRDSQAQMSLNFIDFIAGPLIACIADAFDSLEFMLRNLVSVREHWSEIRKSELEQMENKNDCEKQLELLKSRDAEFIRNFVSRVMVQRSSVTRTMAMLSVQNECVQLARRNSSVLAHELEKNPLFATTVGEKSSKSKSEHEYRRSSSAEDLVKKPMKTWGSPNC